MSQNKNAEDTTYLSIIREQQNTIASLSKNVEDMQTANKDLQATVKALQATIANLEETIAELTRKLFGASSEQTKNASDREELTEESAVSAPNAASGANRSRKYSCKPKSTRAELHHNNKGKSVPL